MIVAQCPSGYIKLCQTKKVRAASVFAKATTRQAGRRSGVCLPAVSGGLGKNYETSDVLCVASDELEASEMHPGKALGIKGH